MKIKIDDSIDLPSRLILISPWVDVTGDDDDLQKMATSTLFGLVQMGKKPV